MVRQKLPERWYIEVTKENREILGKWRTNGSLSVDTEGGYCLNKHPSRKDVGYYIRRFRNIPDSYEEITFEEFEIHILKRKPLLSVIEVW